MDFELLKEKVGKNEVKLNIKLTKKKKNYQNQNGITLIALVVTIVVLLILAGVSLNALFGNNGIIKRAQDAQNKMDEATQNDLDAINGLNEWIDGESTGGDTGEALDIIERYVLGEDKKGISYTTIVDMDTWIFTNNEIISNAENSLKTLSMAMDLFKSELEVAFEYSNRQYIMAIDGNTGITKAVKKYELKTYEPKKIYDGSIKLKDDGTSVKDLGELKLTKKYKIVYTENGETKEYITTSGNYGALLTPGLTLLNKFSFSIRSDDVYFLLYSQSKGRNIEIKQIYEIGEAENFVEENGFMAYFLGDEWGIMQTPIGSYTVPSTVKGKQITAVYLDYMSGNAIFTQPFKVYSLVDKIWGPNVKILTSDISFIFTNYDWDPIYETELDLSECGDDIQIPTDFAEKYPGLTIYVSSAVKENYQEIENIKVKEQ